MKLVFDRYDTGEEIPVLAHLKNRKLAKYLNRETMAAVVAVGKLLNQITIRLDIPFYYATGMLEFQDYGLHDIVAASRDDNGEFCHKLFVEKGIASVSPLNQFKVLQNMPLSFASINFGLTGDNAVVYATAGALVRHALCAPTAGPVLLGAGKVNADGRAECGCALVKPEELADTPWVTSDDEAVTMFHAWYEEGI